MLLGLALQVGLGGMAGLNGTPANNPSISAVTQSCDATTCVLGWTTSIASNSMAHCGTQEAVDDNVNDGSGIITHQLVVSGLTASTAYTCTVISGSSSASISATTAAAATSTPITGVSIGGPSSPSSAVNADTFGNVVSNDGNTYFILDDGSIAGATGYAISLAKYTSLGPTLTASLVNALSGYGIPSGSGFTTADGYDPKANDLWSQGGVLYIAFGRQTELNNPTYHLQYAASFISSPDHGATWNNFQNPGTFTATGAENAPVNLTSFQSVAPSNFACSTFVKYGADDGTNGYLVAANRVDNGNAYVYGLSNGRTSGGGCTWNNGDSLYLWRIPRARMAYQSTISQAVQCWVSGDGSLDANWTRNLANCGSVISNSGALGLVRMEYIPTLNRYLLLTYSYPSGIATTTTTNLLAYDCAHPWGGCTLKTTLNFTVSSTPPGPYDFVPLQTDVLAAGFTPTTFRVMFTGAFDTASYNMYYATMTVSH